MGVSEETKNRKKKIVIIDDHPIVRRGFIILIEGEKDFVVAGEAGDAASAMLLIDKVRPDLALVDISLGGTSGIELTKNITARYPEVSVLIISMYDESVYLERALRAGAKGYIMKQETTDHVILAIRKVLKGEIYVSEPMRDSMVSQFIHGKSNVEEGLRGKLTERETEIVQLIGQGLTTRRIAQELHVSEKTIESHCTNIKNKLGLKNSRELIQYSVKCSLSDRV